MLAFAFVFWLTVEKNVPGAFAGASLAWLAVSVAAWYVRRKMSSVRKSTTGEKKGGPARPRSRPF
jgi:hypothetical protein